MMSHILIIIPHRTILPTLGDSYDSGNDHCSNPWQTRLTMAYIVLLHLPIYTQCSINSSIMGEDTEVAWITVRWSLWPRLIVLLFAFAYAIVARLYLSPLTKFPGPRLAALTKAYAFYFDVIKRGKLPWELIRLHEHYGRRQELYLF
jgi:hypothetical protein